jgi:peptidoglycan/LPS O-acetylase OafA/YrhL
MDSTHDRPRYRPEVDGLRCLAVLPVLLYHAGCPGFAGGFLGVDIFFVISGYLITGLIHSEMEAGTFSLWRFYERRARRILPAMLVVTTLSAAAAWALMTPEALAEFGRALVSVFTFVSNVFFWLRSGYFTTDVETSPLLHTWSLSVEEQFYLLYPPLLLLLRAAGRRRPTVTAPALGFLAVASLALAQWAVSRPGHGEAAFFLIPMRAWELFAGAILALRPPRLAGAPAALRDGLAAVGAALCLLSFAWFDGKVPHPGLRTLAPVVGTCLMLACATPDTRVGRLLARPLLVGIGLISYSLYLFHVPLLAFLRIRSGGAIGPLATTLALGACFPLAWMTWRFVEQPCRDRRRVPLRPFAIAVAAAGAFSLAFGALLVRFDGFPSRIDDQAGLVLARMSAGAAPRRAGIAIGPCHYNPDFISFDRFMREWDCLPRAGDGPSILAVGDSHAGDVAWALRSVGVAIGNIGGPFCPLAPDPADPVCSVILEKARGLVRDGKVQGIVLAKWWRREDVAGDALQRAADYWTSAGVPVLLFTPMPTFTGITERVALQIGPGRSLADIPYDAALLEATEAPFEALHAPGLTIIDTRELFCGSRTGPCSAFDGLQPLLIDTGHLSPHGAGVMGARIAASPRWKEWVASLARAAR